MLPSYISYGYVCNIVGMVHWSPQSHRKIMRWKFHGVLFYITCSLCREACSQVFYSLSSKMSYWQNMQSHKAMRFGYKIVVSFWNLTGVSTALPPRCLSNFRKITHPKPISCCFKASWDLAVRILTACGIVDKISLFWFLSIVIHPIVYVRRSLTANEFAFSEAAKFTCI